VLTEKHFKHWMEEHEALVAAAVEDIASDQASLQVEVRQSALGINYSKPAELLEPWKGARDNEEGSRAYSALMGFGELFANFLEQQLAQQRTPTLAEAEARSSIASLALFEDDYGGWHRTPWRIDGRPRPITEGGGVYLDTKAHALLQNRWVDADPTLQLPPPRRGG
jgi:hypothetical protein